MATPSLKVELMLSVKEKVAFPVDLFTPLLRYAAKHYSEEEAKKAEDDLRKVQEMRCMVEKPWHSSQERIKLLQRYYKALCLIEQRFPISSTRDHINDVTFTWSHTFKTDKKYNVSQRNIHFEKAAVLFNLGAIYSQMGEEASRYQVGRHAEDGFRIACKHFVDSATAFAFLRDHEAQRGAGSNDLHAVDVSASYVGMLQHLMFAQAQACCFQTALHGRAAMEGRITAVFRLKVARQAQIFYEEASQDLSSRLLDGHFEPSWLPHTKAKAALYHAHARYQKAIHLHAEGNIGEEITHLQQATMALKMASKSIHASKKLKPLSQGVSDLQPKVELSLNTALKENSHVYNQRLPPLENLPELPSIQVFESTTSKLEEALDIREETMFTSLVPASWVNTISRYKEMVDLQVNALLKDREDQRKITKAKLLEMSLPDSLYYFQGRSVCQIPDDLRVAVGVVRAEGGPSGLEGMEELKNYRKATEGTLVQVEEILNQEASKDRQYRVQYGDRWEVPIPYTVGFENDISKFREKLNGMATTVAEIERDISDNWSLISILDEQLIEAPPPCFARCQMLPNGVEDTIVGTLTKSLEEINKLESEAAKLENELNHLKEKDNILPKVMISNGYFEENLIMELKKYDPLSEKFERNVESQKKFLDEIQRHNKAFSEIFNFQEYKDSQDQEFKKLREAVTKYWEIKSRIKMGIEVYDRLQDEIIKLKQMCNDHAFAHDFLCSDLLERLQGSMAL